MVLTNSQRQARFRTKRAEMSELRREALLDAKGMMHAVSEYVANGRAVPHDLVHAFLEVEARLTCLFDARDMTAEWTWKRDPADCRDKSHAWDCMCERES